MNRFYLTGICSRVVFVHDAESQAYRVSMGNLIGAQLLRPINAQS